MQASPVLSQSSRSHNSKSNLAEIAARVVEEFKAENETESDFYIDDDGGSLNEKTEGNGDDEDDDEFEFSFVKESEFSPISADEIFSNGQIRPIYPIFGDFMKDSSNLNLNTTSSNEVTSSPPPASIRLPLRKLFMEEERETNNSSCSSSEADDLEAIPPGTYCVWRPKPAVAGETGGGCKKSNSTGSSKRWKFRDLLHRSNSDGKDAFVFLTPKKRESKVENKAEKTTDTAPKAKGVTVSEGNPAVTHYSKSGSDNKRKTYLPYRQDLVGFFANMNGVSRNVHPF